MNNSNELLLLSLKEFYSNDNNINRLLSIINGTSKISLRLIDWFITNHCKTHRDVVIQSDEDKHVYNVYQNYRSQLKAYKKIKFDPFRRRQRIVFFYGDDEHLNTTVGQLNFFKWAIENNILEFISNNIEYLEDCMNTFQKNAKSEKMTKQITVNYNDVQNDHKEEISKDRRIKIKASTSIVSFD